MKLHLPKMLLGAVLAAITAIAAPTYGADTEIWVNFGGTGKVVTGDSKTWNNILGDSAAALSGTYTLVDKDGASTGAAMILSANAVPWSNTSATLDVLKGYLDYQANASGSYWSLSFSFDDIAASGITVNAYNSGDSNQPIAPITINGKNYVGTGEADTVGTNLESTTSWGNNSEGATQTALNGKNTVSVTGLSGTVTMTPMQTTGNDVGRFTLAGLSIVWDGSSAATGIELTSGVNDATSYLEGVDVSNRIYSLSGNADKTSEFKIANGETVQGLQAAANTVTITSDGTIGVSQLWAKSGATLDVHATLTSGSDLSIGGLGRVNISSNQTLNALNSTVETLGVASNTTVTVNGAAQLNNSVHLETDSVLNLNGTADASFILNATGAGKIVLNSAGNSYTIPGYDNGNSVGDAGKVNGINSTEFAGVISVQGGTLYLGNAANEQRYFGLDLGSLESIDLDGGSMRLFGAASTISTINVNTASSITIHQASVTEAETNEAIAGRAGYSIGNLVLKKDLFVRTSWRSVVEIGKLSGSGDINMYTDGNDRVLSLYVNEVDASAGMNMNFAANVNVTLGGKEDSLLNIGGTITNAASLTVNGVIIIADDLSSFEMHEPNIDGGKLSVNETDGYLITSGSSYYLVKNTGTCTFTPTTATYGGQVINLTKGSDGSVTFIGGVYQDTIYRVNTADVTVGGESPSANTAAATSFVVAEGRTLTIAGSSETENAGGLLKSSTGAGNVLLTTDAELKQGQKTQLTGKLTISNGATLTVGQGGDDTSSLSSFDKGVVLDGASLLYNGNTQELASLSVTRSSTLGISNKNNGHRTYTINGTTLLNANLEVTDTVDNEHGDLVIKNLSGSGMLSSNGGNGTWGAIAMKVEKLTEYTGTIKVDGGNRSSYANYVEFGTATEQSKSSAFSTLKGLELTNKAYAVVNSNSDSTIEKAVLNNGSLRYVSDGGDYTYSLDAVSVDGASSISIEGATGGTVEVGKLKLNSGTLSVTGSLTIGTLELDLSKYTDMAQTYTLVSTSGEGANVELSTAYSAEYNGYTAIVSGSGSSTLTLSFATITGGDSLTTTVTGFENYANGMLTLKVDGDITESIGSVIVTGFDKGVLDSIFAQEGIDANTMVGITLTDGTTSIVGTAEQNVGFQGADGVYYGAQVGSQWQYNVSYIPEPTTATLSLLALCGLATRRRRK